MSLEAGRLGRVNVLMAIGGAVLPVVLAIVARVLLDHGILHTESTYCILIVLLFAATQLVALVCGIMARRAMSGKAGMVISVGSVLLLLLFVIVLTSSERESSTERERLSVLHTPSDTGEASAEDSGPGASLAIRLIGTWVSADGSGVVIEFTTAGTMPVRNKAGERIVLNQGHEDLPYAFIAADVVQVDPVKWDQVTDAAFREQLKAEVLVFSVEINEDRLTMRGKEGSATMVISADGNKEIMFPGSEAEPLELVRQQLDPDRAE